MGHFSVKIIQQLPSTEYDMLVRKKEEVLHGKKNSRNEEIRKVT
jgi:hypothetical protein